MASGQLQFLGRCQGALTKRPVSRPSTLASWAQERVLLFSLARSSSHIGAINPETLQQRVRDRHRDQEQQDERKGTDGDAVRI